MSEPRQAAALERLSSQLGSRFTQDAQTLLAVAGDKWFARGEPAAAVFAESTADVQTVLCEANAAGIPVTTRGAGYGYVGGCVPVNGGIVLDLSRMNRILEISESDFVAVVQPGVITGELQTAVRERGLFYPPDPASLKNCSLGGNIGTNAGGPRCLKYGVTRHYVLGLEAVLADGSVVHLGARTHKNKTGFDLIGLLTGSEGLLGVVTEATLRLLPLPPARAALSGGFADIRTAAAAVEAIFRHGHLPAAVEVADRFTLQAARDRLGSERVPAGDAHLLVEIDGQPAGVAAELASLAALVEEMGATGLQLADSDASVDSLWLLRREFSESLKATGLVKLNEDVVVPRGRLVDLIEFARDLQERSGFPIACFGHAGDGNIHVNIMVGDAEQPDVRERADAALDALFSQILEWSGAITGEHGIGLAKKRWFPQAVDPATRALHRTIKHAMDPNGILNPGKFV